MMKDSKRKRFVFFFVFFVKMETNKQTKLFLGFRAFNWVTWAGVTTNSRKLKKHNSVTLFEAAYV